MIVIAGVLTLAPARFLDTRVYLNQLEGIVIHVSMDARVCQRDDMKCEGQAGERQPNGNDEHLLDENGADVGIMSHTFSLAQGTRYSALGGLAVVGVYAKHVMNTLLKGGRM